MFSVWRILANTALRFVNFCIRRMEVLTEKDRMKTATVDFTMEVEK